LQLLKNPVSIPSPPEEEAYQPLPNPSSRIVVILSAAKNLVISITYEAIEKQPLTPMKAFLFPPFIKGG
jgi:hypothetical protein